MKKIFTPDERDDNSNNKIWKKDVILSLYFHNNDCYDYNSIEQTIKFLQAAKRLVKKHEYVNVYVEPHLEEGDNSTLETVYIKVKGDRLETDKEQKDRISHRNNRERVKYEDYKRQHDYYSSPYTKEKLKAANVIL